MAGPYQKSGFLVRIFDPSFFGPARGPEFGPDFWYGIWSGFLVRNLVRIFIGPVRGTDLVLDFIWSEVRILVRKNPYRGGTWSGKKIENPDRTGQKSVKNQSGPEFGPE